MKLLLCNRDGRPSEAWLNDLRRALPEAQVDEWQPGVPADYDAAIVWNPPQQLFDEQPQLKAVFNLGAGVDKLMALHLPPDLQIVRLEDAGMAVQMAEYVCHALIRFYREFDWYAQQQQEQLWKPRCPWERDDFPVGIMGLGALGARVAQAVRQFDFPVLGWSRTRRDLEGVRCYAGKAELSAFLKATRVLVCLLPLTDETRGILNREALERVQLGGYLINVARGALVVEVDLRNLLEEGHLAGATLDVFEDEPLPTDHWLWTQPFVNVTPHISAHTVRRDAVVQVVLGVRALMRGALPAGVVKRSHGY